MKNDAPLPAGSILTVFGKVGTQAVFKDAAPGTKYPDAFYRRESDCSGRIVVKEGDVYHETSMARGFLEENLVLVVDVPAVIVPLC